MSTFTESCTYSNPVRYDNTVPTLPTHVFYFKDKTCTQTNTATSSGSVTFTGYNPTTTIATSTDIKIYGAMSAGEVIIALFLFVVIFLKMVELLARALSAIKTKKRFLGYGGGDVEIREDL